MIQRRVGTLAVLAFACGGCSLILDFDKPPIDGAPDSPVNDTACMAFEPNDSPTTAAAITPGDYEAGICMNDTDYFRFSVNGTEAVLARITFDNRNGAGDLDLRLLRGDAGSTIDDSRTSADMEEVMCPGGNSCNAPLMQGEYLLHVLGFNAAVQAEYVLHLETGAAPIDAGID